MRCTSTRSKPQQPVAAALCAVTCCAVLRVLVGLLPAPARPATAPAAASRKLVGRPGVGGRGRDSEHVCLGICCTRWTRRVDSPDPYGCGDCKHLTVHHSTKQLTVHLSESCQVLFAYVRTYRSVMLVLHSAWRGAQRHKQVPRCQPRLLPVTGRCTCHCARVESHYCQHLSRFINKHNKLRKAM